MNTILRNLSRAWLLLLILGVWEGYARVQGSVFFPPVSVIFERFLSDWVSGPASHLWLSEQFFSSAGTSLGRLAQGWGLAVIVGVVIGLVLGFVPTLNHMYAPMVRFWIAVPNAILLPVVVKVFGVTDAMNIFMIFFGTVWLVIIKTADGVASLDSMYLRVARSLHIGKGQIFTRILLPAVLPDIMAGLRISIGIGLILMIISEFFATTRGLGYDIQYYQQVFDYEGMWSAFVLIAVLSLLLNTALSHLEARLLHWHRRSEGMVRF